jgi:hypothetical protein
MGLLATGRFSFGEGEDILKSPRAISCENLEIIYILIGPLVRAY